MRAIRPSLVVRVAMPMVGVLAGCSVMQIDVDVYKGPLANHEDVLTEQVAVMAVSAEPLLIRLERELCRQSVDFRGLESLSKVSANEQDKSPKSDHEKSLKIINGCNYKRTDIVDVLKIVRKYCKKNDACNTYEVVTGARSLYYDLDELDPIGAELAALSRKVRGNLDRLRISLAILIPSSSGNPTENQKRLVQWLEEEIRNERAPVELALGYVEFFNPEADRNFRLPTPVRDKILVAPNIGGEQRAKFAKELKEILRAIEPLEDEKSWPSDNTRFSILADGKFLEAQATILFPGKTERQALFKQEVSRIANSYLFGRLAIESILTDVLAAIKQIGPALAESDATGQATLEAMAGLAATLIHTQHLSAALTATADGVPELAEKLRTSLENSGVDLGSVTPYSGHELGEQLKFQEAVQKLLVEEPLSTASALLAAHAAFMEPRFKVGSKSVFGPPTAKSQENTKKRYNNTPDRRRHGLAVFIIRKAHNIADLKDNNLPDPTDNDLIVSEIFGQGANTNRAIQVREGISGAFERGRLPEGLYTRVKLFLETSEDEKTKPCEALPYCDQGETQGQVNRRLLHDTMVRFAHRVLFVVNNEALFSNISGSTKTFVQVLQTVGNSILVHVDAMRQEEAHAKKLRDAKEREAAAIRQVYGGSPSEAYARLLSALQGRVTNLATEVKALEASQAPLKKSVQAAEADVTKGQIAYMAALPEAIRRLAHGWFALGYNPTKLGYNIAQTADDSARKGKIDNLVRSASPTVGTLYAAIENMMKTDHATAINQASDNSPKVQKLADAVTLLTDTGFKNSLATPPFSKVSLMADLEAVLHRKHAEEKQRLLAHPAKLVTVKAAEKAWKEAVAKRNAEAKKLLDLPKQVTSAKAKIPPLEAAATAFAEVRSQVTAAVEQSNTNRYGQAVYDQLGTSLRSAQATAKTKGDTTAEEKYRHASEILAKLSPPVDVPTGQTGKLNDAKEVLDGLIAALRHRHLQALAENDNQAAQIARSAGALAEGYRQRADMIYLRPAMAYLRTSFTASNLQDNYLAWRNMLTDHGIRSSVPLIPQLAAKDNAEVTTEIDKQFWQNINRVRVAGAGDTNYAIAKDDVGNWYVKSYSTDVSDIVNSAKNLGLFAAGPALSTRLPIQTQAQVQQPPIPGGNGETPTQASGQQQTQAAPKSSLEKQYEQFLTVYRNQSKSDFEKAKTDAITFKQRVVAGWKNRKLDKIVGTMDALLDFKDDEAIKTALIDRELKEEELEKAPNLLAEGLRAIKTYHFRVARDIEGFVSTGSPEIPLEQRRAAVAVLTDVILGEDLGPLLEQAQRSAKNFETTLTIVGKVAK
ncbi:hypothetical protein MJD09_18405 [bacterium]|nr:hypothetical protein [bacterium]